MNIKKIRLEGISEREINSRYQLAKTLLDSRNIEYREDKGLKTLWIYLNVEKKEEIELFFTYGHITAYLWRNGQDVEREEFSSILYAFQFFNQNLERSRRDWK